MRVKHANTLIYKIRVHAANLMTVLNRMRDARNKWDSIDAGNMATPPPALLLAIATQSQNLLKTVHRLRALRNEWDSLDAGTVITDSMIGGDNNGITKAQVAAVIGTTVDSLNTLLNSGHATNLYKLDVPDADVTKANCLAVIATTLDALNSLMAQGHATNCYTITV